MATEPIASVKVCTKCLIEYQATKQNFYASKMGKYGLRSICKTCCQALHVANKQENNAYQRAYYIINRDRARAREKANRIKPDVCAARQKRAAEYYILNKAIYRARDREWRRNNPERHAANQKRNREKRGPYPREYSAKVRAKRAKSPGQYTNQDIRNCFVNQDAKCAYCDTLVSHDFEIDHFIPLARGGTNWPDNIRVSCRPCNRSKHAKMPWEWQPDRFSPPA